MTIREIAALAGVSPAAVSLVINNRKGVSDETRKRILSVMEESGYSPSVRKKSVRPLRIVVLKYRVHGIAFEENQGFIASIVDRIESECRHYGYDLMMYNCEPETATATIRDMMNAAPDGVILIATELPKEDFPLLDLIDVPLVALDQNLYHPGTDCVVMDNANLAASLVEYLADCGHRDIGYFKFSRAVRNCDERYEGYLAALERLGLEKPEPILLKPTVDGAFEDLARMIRSGEYVPHGAVVCDNDTIAIGAIKAIREAGYSIPEDISIIGFDDIPFSATTMPALTTMRISRSAMGEMAVSILRRRMRHPDYPCMKLLLGGKLIIRNSTKVLTKAPEEQP